MSPSSNSAIRVLLIHDTQNEAEPIVNAIRNSGTAVRSHFIASQDELVEMIGDESWDLVIAKLNSSALDASQSISIIKKSATDLPTIAVIDHYDAEGVSEALQSGACDVILEQATQHLVHAVKREVAARHDRQNLITLTSVLKDTEKWCLSLLESSVEAIAYVHDGMHIYANSSYLDLFGYTDDLDELQCIPIIDLVASEDIGKLKEALKKTQKHQSVELSLKALKDSEEFLIHMMLSEASYEGELCTQVVIRKEITTSTKHQVPDDIDPITGIYNRKYFDAQIEKSYGESASKKEQKIVAVLGISNFNSIKIATSVTGAEILLKNLTECLVENLPNDIYLSHYSDNTFTLILPTSDLPSAQSQLTDVQQLVSKQLFEIDGKTLQVSTACGLSFLDATCKNGKEALKQAESAYDTAKTNKQSQSFFDKSDVENLSDNSYAARVEHALSHDGLHIQFQPIMSLRGDSQEHYDILVRLRDKEGNYEYPENFLPHIESTDLGKPLDRWVTERSVQMLSEHRKQGNNTQVMIHLTAASIQDSTFLPWVNSLLKRHSLPGDCLCFQITEAIALSYLKTAKAFSKGLSLLKCQLSINHFGADENCFSLAHHLDISYARVDKSFVAELIETGQASDELNALFKNIHENNINSIVPKIESAEILALLWELGINYIQGYYLQRPLDEMDYNFDAEEEAI